MFELRLILPYKTQCGNTIMLHQKVYGLLYNVIDIIYQCDREIVLLQLLLSHDEV